MRFQKYISESASKGGVQKYFKELQKMEPNKAEKLMKRSWKELSNILKVRLLEDDAVKIINKHLNTHYKTLKEIDKEAIKSMPPINMNEDLAHYWGFVKSEAFPTLSFYPALSAWMEIDKLLKSTGEFDSVKFGVYGLFWLVLISSKFIMMWRKWKTDNRKEFEKEGGKNNPFAINRNKNKNDNEFKFE